ncbi:hypothetical protein P692DRAFT_201409282 [Suillus brevipes Sb2]|nr:hypothetical protein P692DRAFT_201409282 [Suillus brevipes Sb2]
MLIYMEGINRCFDVARHEPSLVLFPAVSNSPVTLVAGGKLQFSTCTRHIFILSTICGRRLTYDLRPPPKLMNAAPASFTRANILMEKSQRSQ